MPAPRRMMRRTARRTSRRQGAMNSNEPYEEEVQEAPVQQTPVAPAPAQQANDDPKVILANRLANGEITPEEYQAAIAALG